ncbi:hypothetical protein GOV12_02355 [Candidatus Pacearchaeota archaeon]|nr:hypothetical protein [Candidatus Pacearchaeota archaeon]
MAKFLNSSGISYHLERLIKNADMNLFLVSPFLKFNSRIKQLLEERNRLKRDIRIIYGKVDLQREESNWLKSMDSIKVLFCKNLHSKCYINEKEAIITSMNLYEFSQQNNNEMGIYVTKEDDLELYKEIYEEVNGLILISEQVAISIEKVDDKPKKKASTTANGGNGHCIRCDAKIKADIKSPLCLKCYKNWNKYKDKDFEEKYCLICGQENKGSMNKPVCINCYKKNYKK